MEALLLESPDRVAVNLGFDPKLGFARLQELGLLILSGQWKQCVSLALACGFDSTCGKFKLVELGALLSVDEELANQSAQLAGTETKEAAILTLLECSSHGELAAIRNRISQARWAALQHALWERRQRHKRIARRLKNRGV